MNFIYKILAIVYTLKFIIIIFLPIFFATKLTSEARKINKHLNDRLLDGCGGVFKHGFKILFNKFDRKHK